MLGDLVVGAVDLVADVAIDALTGSNDDDEDEGEAGPEEDDAGSENDETGPDGSVNDIPVE